MKITVVILFLSLASLTTSAQIERKPAVIKTDSTQTNGNNTQGDKQSRKERFKELDLTREQKGRLKEIMQANKASKETIENNTQLSGQEKKKQMRELQKAQMQKIQAILTPEQIEKFKASKPNDP
jgi:glucosamine 6-phosphate synthetase-like amidotransferase/phosphosugar isomerase protein